MEARVKGTVGRERDGDGSWEKDEGALSGMRDE